MENINEIKKRFKDEWVLVEVIEKDNLNRPSKGKVITHSKNRNEIYDALKKARGKHTYQFHTGRTLERGYAAAFNQNG